MRHFIWRVCTRTLSGRALLKHCHLIDDDLCPLCKTVSESLIHTLFTSTYVNDALKLLGLAKFMLAGDLSSMLDVIEGWGDVEEDKLVGWGFLAWSLWFRMNQVVFEEKLIPNHLLVEYSCKIKCEYVDFTTRIHNTTTS